MRRYWLSWWQPDPDYWPPVEPPTAPILGWWCSGVRSDDDWEDKDFSICAFVEADTQVEAWAAVHANWPNVGEKRFCELVEPDYLPSNRFPLEPWMIERINGNFTRSEVKP